MTIQAAQRELQAALTAIYDGREAANIADWVMEHLTGCTKVDRLLRKQDELPENKRQLFDQYKRELLTHKPVQYVLKETWFAGTNFYVNEHVLIPRPETEELVEWIVAENKQGKILDVGTGSGCIAVTLKKKNRVFDVEGCDVSVEALEVANENRRRQEALVSLCQVDFLDPASWTILAEPDILVSNPPYIPLRDKDSMSANVLNYEPHLALFVQDNDPLIFYKALIAFFEKRMRPDGRIYAEIHEDLAADLRQLFSAKGFAHIEIRKDMQGKDRMIKATR